MRTYRLAVLCLLSSRGLVDKVRVGVNQFNMKFLETLKKWDLEEFAENFMGKYL